MSGKGPDLIDSVAGAGQPSVEEIRAQLKNVLSSPAFLGSKRCQKFLDYVCEKSLAGEAATLKERTLASDVFGRNPDSDLGEDTIVRVGAREVRKRLAQYYVTTEGALARVRIDLPSGSYAPDFRYSQEAKDAVIAKITLAEASPIVADSVAWRRKWAVLAGVAAIVLVLILLSGRKLTNSSSKTFQDFWKPVLTGTEPLLLAVGHPLVYHPSLRAGRLNDELLGERSIPSQQPLQVDPKKLDGSDMVPVMNQYVGFGDMVAATEVATMLGRNGKSVRAKLASSVTYADLRATPAMLIGALTNRWTLELGQSWRFRFDRKAGVKNVIVDTGVQPNKVWSIESHADGTTNEDYILVSRIRHSSTNGMLLVAAGIKQFGTEAAGRLLTDPDQLHAAFRGLPAGWVDRNVQMVLHVRVIGNAPAEPDVVAWHVW